MRTLALAAPALATLLTAAAAARADDLVVPRDYASIDAALAHARGGDRIVVAGGRHVNVTVAKDGVKLAGRNATLVGTTLVTGAGVTITGFRVASDGRVTIEGDDAVFERNRVGRHTLVEVNGADRARVEHNSFAPAGIRIGAASDVVLRWNRFPRTAEAQEYARGTLIEGNRVGLVHATGKRCVIRSNHAFVISTQTDGAAIESNVVSRGIIAHGHDLVLRGNHAGGGIGIYGDDATVQGNRVMRTALGIMVTGSRADVVENTVTAGSIFPDADFGVVPGCPAIQVDATEPGGVVQDNDVTHASGTGIVVHADGVTVTGNTVNGVSPSTSVTIVGDGNVVADNVVTQTQTSSAAGDGIDVQGDANVVRDNTLTGVAVDAVVVTGDGNAITGTVIDRAGGCGVLVTADATATVVAECTVTDCALGLANLSDDAKLTGTTLSDSRFADVLDLGAFSVFEGNAFESLSHDPLLAPHR